MNYYKPKYLILEDDIKKAINSGILKPGDKVASESELKKKYNISAITVRKAFNDLINEKYLVGVQGRGTFVTNNKANRILSSLTFSDKLIKQGYKLDRHIDKITEIFDKSISDKLLIYDGKPITMISLIKLVNGQPIAYQSSYIASSILNKEDAQEIYESKSIYKMFAKKGITATRANDNYSFRIITDKEIAGKMKLDINDYAFFVKRTAYDASGNLIEYAESYYNKDWYSVTVDVQL